MSAPKFEPGFSGSLGSVNWRVRQGRKGPADLILDIEGPHGFAPVEMALGGLMADFFYQNEERLFPREFGFDGGRRYLLFLRACVERGWHGPSMELRGQRLARRSREAAA